MYAKLYRTDREAWERVFPCLDPATHFLAMAITEANYYRRFDRARAEAMDAEISRMEDERCRSLDVLGWPYHSGTTQMQEDH